MQCMGIQLNRVRREKHVQSVVVGKHDGQNDSPSLGDERYWKNQKRGVFFNRKGKVQSEKNRRYHDHLLIDRHYDWMRVSLQVHCDSLQV